MVAGGAQADLDQRLDGVEVTVGHQQTLGLADDQHVLGVVLGAVEQLVQVVHRGMGGIAVTLGALALLPRRASVVSGSVAVRGGADPVVGGVGPVAARPPSVREQCRCAVREPAVAVAAVCLCVALLGGLVAGLGLVVVDRGAEVAVGGLPVVGLGHLVALDELVLRTGGRLIALRARLRVALATLAPQLVHRPHLHQPLALRVGPAHAVHRPNRRRY